MVPSTRFRIYVTELKHLRRNSLRNVISLFVSTIKNV